MEELNSKNYGVMLIDCYGSLLTEKQKNILEEYYNDDLSLSELAELHGISKSAIYDMIKKSLDKLNEYEEKLQFVSKRNKIEQIIECEEDVEVLKEKIKETLDHGI